MIEPSDEMTTILWLIVAVLSLTPFIIFLISYARVKSRRLFIVTIAFFLFFIKALVLSMKLFLQNYDDEVWWSVAAILDIVIIGLIAFSLSKKANRE
jgi:hypothetical protein